MRTLIFCRSTVVTTCSLIIELCWSLIRLVCCHMVPILSGVEIILGPHIMKFRQKEIVGDTLAMILPKGMSFQKSILLEPTFLI